MKWYEFIFIAIAIFIVLSPFILNKKSKKSCKSGCACCKMRGSCPLNSDINKIKIDQ